MVKHRSLTFDWEPEFLGTPNQLKILGDVTAPATAFVLLDKDIWVGNDFLLALHHPQGKLRKTKGVRRRDKFSPG